MSVLFQALDKAALTPKGNKAASSEKDIASFFKPPQASRRRPVLGYVFVVCLVGLTVAALAFRPEDLFPHKPVAPIPVAEIPPPALQSNSKGLHAKPIQSDPDGIELTADALKDIATTDGSTPVPKARDRAQKNRHVQVTDDKETKPDMDLSAAHDLLEDGKYRAALQRYDAILAKRPDDRAALEGKIYALQQASPNEALGSLKKLAARLPQEPLVRAGIAMVETKRDNDKAAIESWKKAIEMDANNETYRLSLAILYDRNGQESAALDMYKTLKKPWPKQVDDRVTYLSAKDGGPQAK